MKKSTTELKKTILEILCNNLDFDKAINEVLAMVGAYFGVDRAYIFENSDDNSFCTNTYEWCNKGIEPEIQMLQKVHYDEDLGVSVDYFFLNGDVFFCKDINVLPPKIDNILRKQNITGVLFCAIRKDGEFKGYIGFDNCSENIAEWMENQDAIDTLEYTAHLMTLSIMDYRKKSEQLAVKDAELRASNDKLENILSNISSGIIIYKVDHNNNITVDYVNDHVAIMAECSYKEIINIVKKDYMVMINEEYKKSFKDAFEKAVMVGNASVTYKATTFSGRMKWITLKLSALKGNSGDVIVNGTLFDITEEKVIQRQLKESAEIVNVALHSADAMVWVYDFTTNKIIGKASSMTQHIFGNTIRNVPESLIEKGYVHPDYIDSYRKLFELVKNSTIAVQGDFYVQNSDGTGYVWERIILEPRYENGQISRAIGTSINITAWKEKESQYQKFIDEMNNDEDENLIGKARYNLSSNHIIYYGRNTDNCLAIDDTTTFDSALEGMLLTTVNLEDKEHLREMLDRKTLLQKFTKGQKAGEFEYKRVQQNGPAFWSRLKYFMFEEPKSKDIIFFVYTYDITDSVRERSMLEKLGSIEYDVLGLIDVKTHQFESKSIKGIKSIVDSKNKFINGTFEDVIHNQVIANVREDERSEIEKNLTIDSVVNNLEHMPLFTVAFSAIKRNHTRVRKQMNFTYLDDSKTTIFYYCTDITAMYDREQAQLQKTEDALEAAKSASESKTEFFSRMSHDMRTPMNGILGIASLLTDETDIDVLHQNIAKIESSGQYLLGLINDTLDFQRIESGKLKLTPEIVNCHELVDMSMEMVKPAIEKKKINFKAVNCDSAFNYYIRIDPIRIKQIFVNLISNAIKFTPEGGTIVFEYENLGVKDSISYSRFYVRDTGIGMSPDFINNKIFKPFSQENNSVTGLYAGSGLGLSIVKSLVSLMNGKISVESELGSGTTFIVELAIERIEQKEADGDKANKDKKHSNAIQNLKGKKILLAEDHPLNAEIAKKLLEKVGCEILWAKNGKECYEIFSESHDNEYDAILMDIRMPVMDGLEAAKAIRESQHSDAKKIPIIAMTANAYDTDVKKSLEVGMNAHIAKPIEPAIMYETIARNINDSKVNPNYL